MPSESGITIPRFLLLAGLLLALPSLLFARQGNPQPPKPADLTLDAILIRLQNNLTVYRATVPDFFCDEQVVSTMYMQHQPYGRTATDSIFRLRRLEASKSSIDKSGTDKLIHRFIESREIKTVDKKPAKKQDLSGPAIFAGAFSNALQVVSLDLRDCYNYHLVPHQRLHRHPVLVIDYALKDTAISDQACPGPEMHSGRAFIDPQTMEIVRIEQRTPDHEINPGVYGPWTWSIDYAEVIFNDKPFWMPKTVSSIATAKDSRFEWTFVATYRNYHKLTVTSRILPDVDYNPK
jgi:hypothetical protein